jgi:hypothetical protein
MLVQKDRGRCAAFMGAAGRATWGEAWVRPVGYELSSEYRRDPRGMFSPCWWRSIEFNIVSVVVEDGRAGFLHDIGALTNPR